VRMVTVDGVPDLGIEPSLELCGGTHVRKTGEIGDFLLLADSAIAAGVRRIEARCGEESRQYLRGEIARFGDSFAAAGEKLHAGFAARGGDDAGRQRPARREQVQEPVEAVRAEAARLAAPARHEPATAVRENLHAMERDANARLDVLKQALAAAKK